SSLSRRRMRIHPDVIARIARRERMDSLRGNYEPSRFSTSGSLAYVALGVPLLRCQFHGLGADWRPGEFDRSGLWPIRVATRTHGGGASAGRCAAAIAVRGNDRSLRT